MTKEERKLALYCLKANSDLHGEVCEECSQYPECDHFIQDNVMEKLIEELEQEPCEDAISRQAYIERYRKWGYSEFGRKIDNEALAIRVAMSLPPVTPRIKTGEDWNAVLDELKRIGRNAFKDDTDYDNLFNFISGLPNVKQEPRTGHWITTRTFMHDGEYYCNKCKCDSPNNEKWDYCPNCGARMVEPQEGGDKE